MPNSIPVNSVVEKNRLDSDSPFIVLLEIAVVDSGGNVVETLRLCRNTEDFIYKSNTYTAYPFDIELSSESGELPNITLSAKDYSRTIQARMQEYGGGIGSGVKIMVLNVDNVNEPEVVENFVVLASSVKDYVVEFNLGVENSLRRTIPRRTQLRDRCSFVYKSPNCGYIGPLPTCDLSLQGPNGCSVHNNSRSYGGYPGLKSNGQRF